MIVWLASFPRSGNTLLRTVLYQTLGYGSYNDEIDPHVRQRVALTDAVEREFGHMELPEPWPAFYARASAAREKYFVKTHLPPRDGQPAVYVVRDGRRALVSYARFHRQFHAARAKPLLDLVVGDDYYGDWSGHHDEWVERTAGDTLVVRYEDLVDSSEELLARLGEFVGHGEAPRPWKNPFPQMHRANPGFFAGGRSEWEGDAEWTVPIDRIFFSLHGAMMERLGYASRDEVTAAVGGIGEEERKLAELAHSLAREKRALARTCHERQGVIDVLQRACDERLALIKTLSTN